MNLLFKISRFSGGAPMSMLEYTKLLNTEYENMSVMGEYSFNESIFEKNNIKTIDIPEFKSNRPIKNIINLFKIRSLTENKKPELIIMGTVQDCIYGTLLERIIKTPILYIIPGGEIPEYIPKRIHEKPIIVFSEENKKTLNSYGINTKTVNVIPNRFSFSNDFTNSKSFEINKDIRINFLLISRIDKTKMKSIEFTIEMIEKLQIQLPNIDIKLTILGDGDENEKISNLVTRINRRQNKDLIIIEGYKENVVDYIIESQVVIGKGRCLIDAMVYQRYAICVSEDYKFNICQNKTYYSLKKNNFSGRGMNSSLNIEDLVNLVERISNDNDAVHELHELSIKTQRDYNILHARESILDIIKEAKNQTNDNSFTKFIVNYIMLYVKIISIKLHKRKLS